MKFIVGVLFGILLVLGGAAAVVITGSFNTAATVPPNRQEQRIARYALDRSVEKRAPKKENPFASSPEVLREGLAHYRENCVLCHGAPGVDAGEIGEGLNPPAPDLTLPRVQSRSDGQLFWITSEGIRMTGMPAFSPTHGENEIWHIVAFLRHLPELTDEEQKLLREALSEGEHHHEEASAPPPPAGTPHAHAPGTAPHEH